VKNAVAHAVAGVSSRYLEQGLVSALPSERRLAEEFGVSRRSMRKALALLTEQGRIYQRSGGRIRYVSSPGADVEALPIEAPHAFSPMPSHALPTIRLLANDLTQLRGADAVAARWRRWMADFRRAPGGSEVTLLPWPVVGSIPDVPFDGFDVLEGSAHNSRLYAPPGGWQALDAFAVDETWPQPAASSPPLWQDATHHGRLLGVPFGAAVPCLAVNRCQWEEYRGETPADDWTWDECLGVAEMMTRASGRAAFALTNVSVLLTSCGFDVYGGGGGAEDDAVAAVVDRICRLSEIFATRYVLEPVAVGTVPFSPVISCSIPTLESRHQGKLHYLPHPGQPGGTFYRYTTVLSMARTTRLPLDCWQLMRFLVSRAVQADVARNGNLLPAWPCGDDVAADSIIARFPFLSRTLQHSRPLPMSDSELLAVETRVLGPAFQDWHRARRVTAHDIRRLSEQLAEYREHPGLTEPRSIQSDAH
jgi:hypothetical protein